MKIYTINLAVDTKDTDMYDKVSLNEFPIIVFCNTENELKEYLSSDDTIHYIKNIIKSQKVLETSQWRIRSIYNNEVHEIVWDVLELIKDLKI